VKTKPTEIVVIGVTKGSDFSHCAIFGTGVNVKPGGVIVELTESAMAAAISIKNLLFATDFSDASESALPYALAIGRRYGSTLHAVHVVSESAFVMSSG